MADYHQIDQIEEDTSSESEKHEGTRELGFFQRHFSTKSMLILHITIFALYILSILYVMQKQPSNHACDYKLSTHCQYP
jgi:hypothetical protein